MLNGISAVVITLSVTCTYAEELLEGTWANVSSTLSEVCVVILFVHIELIESSAFTC